MRKVSISLDPEAIDALIKELEEEKVSVQRKLHEAARELAEFGANHAGKVYSQAMYVGVNDVSVFTKERKHGYSVIASGNAAAFIEFGAGATFGEGHPMAGELGMQPGSWSTSELGKGHWDDPEGWYFMGEDGKWHLTFGHPPAMAMFEAQLVMQEYAPSVVRSKFE